MRFLPAILTLFLASLAYAQQEPVYVVTHIDLMPTGVNPGIAALKQLEAGRKAADTSSSSYRLLPRCEIIYTSARNRGSTSIPLPASKTPLFGRSAARGGNWP